MQPTAAAQASEAAQVLVQPAMTADPVVEPVVAVNPVVDPTVTANPVVDPVVNANPMTDVTDPTTATTDATVSTTNEPTTSSTNSYTGGTDTLGVTGPQTTLGSITGSAGDLTATGPVNTVYAIRIQPCAPSSMPWRCACVNPAHELDMPMTSRIGRHVGPREEHAIGFISCCSVRCTWCAWRSDACLCRRNLTVTNGDWGGLSVTLGARAPTLHAEGSAFCMLHSLSGTVLSHMWSASNTGHWFGAR